MESEEMVKSIYKLQAELGILTNSVGSLATSLSDLVKEVSEVHDEMIRAQSYCDVYCSKIYVTEKNLDKMLAPMRRLYYGTAGAILTWVAVNILSKVFFK